MLSQLSNLGLELLLDRLFFTLSLGRNFIFFLLSLRLELGLCLGCFSRQSFLFCLFLGQARFLGLQRLDLRILSRDLSLLVLDLVLKLLHLERCCLVYVVFGGARGAVSGRGRRPRCHTWLVCIGNRVSSTQSWFRLASSAD